MSTQKAPRPAREQSIAFRWHDGALTAVGAPHVVRLADLLHIERQKAALLANTRHFVDSRPATRC